MIRAAIKGFGLGVGLVVGTVGAILWLLRDPKPKDEGRRFAHHMRGSA